MTARIKQAKRSSTAHEEQRSFIRFDVPGASLSYHARSFLRKKPAEEFCPAQNLSRGGLKMLCREPLRQGQKIAFRLNLPEEEAGLEWTGRVVWIFPVLDADFAFTAGICFDPLDAARNPKAAAVLARLTALEKHYTPHRP